MDEIIQAAKMAAIKFESRFRVCDVLTTFTVCRYIYYHTDWEYVILLEQYYELFTFSQ